MSEVQLHEKQSFKNNNLYIQIQKNKQYSREH